MYCLRSKTLLTLITLQLVVTIIVASSSKYTKNDLLRLRKETKEMFNHAYNGYLEYAYPYDELRPLTCDGVDTWGSYSLTLIDALDTLVVMGNYTEFERVVHLLTENINFDMDINVSVFETNIRIIGGLLSAHILSHKAGIKLEPSWPCDGPLLRLAENVAKRILPAFDTPTGMPYGTVNLKYGVPKDETSVTCTAGVGTFIIEFGTLSRLTGNPIYEEVATKALYAIYKYKSEIGLVGNHIDVLTGSWTALDSGIGAGVDSYFEYLVKGSLLFDKPEFMSMFKVLHKSIDAYLKHDNWYFWVSMHKGLVTLPVFQSLEAYWPGLLSFMGNVNDTVKSIRNYHSVWKQYGFTPEFFNVIQQETSINKESYPLRPELIESVMYLYRATGNPYFLDVGVDILRSIQHSAITKCGYATIKNCRDHSQENRMESFFLAETTKYLYLLFDPDNFIHNPGGNGIVFETESGNTCVINAGGYIFNTEAHPIDPGILDCCFQKPEEEEEEFKYSSDWYRKSLNKSVKNLEDDLHYFEYYFKNDSDNCEVIDDNEDPISVSLNKQQSTLMDEIKECTQQFLNEMHSFQEIINKGNIAWLDTPIEESNFLDKNDELASSKILLSESSYAYCSSINGVKRAFLLDGECMMDELEFNNMFKQRKEEPYNDFVGNIERNFNITKKFSDLNCNRQQFVQRLSF